MSLIARTDGATSGEPIEVRVGTLDDIRVSNRANWRTVQEVRANTTENETLSLPYYQIQPDGSVQRRHDAVALPDYLIKKRLREYARQLRKEKENAGMSISGNTIDTSEEGRVKLFNDYTALAQGWETSITYETPDGYGTANTSQLATACQGITQYRQSLITTEQSIMADITSETITTKAQIDGYAWPPNAI